MLEMSLSITRGHGLGGSVKGIEEVVYGAWLLAFQHVLDFGLRFLTWIEFRGVRR
jgi:hypothetical protein